MASFCARFCVCFVLQLSVYVASVNAYAVKQRPKRQYVCNGSLQTINGEWSKCICRVQFRTVTTICCTSNGCVIVRSRSGRRSCPVRCLSHQRQPVPQSVRVAGSSYQVQCGCPAGYSYNRQTGCCQGACQGCRSYQICITRRGVQNIAYCEDTCNGYSCGSGQECYLTTSQCQLVGGVQICPRVARCRDANPCYLLQCKSYQRCRVIGNIRFCEDSCEGYTRCQNYEQCYLHQVRYCSASNCVFGDGAACRLRATKPGKCPVIQATRCFILVSQCFQDDQCPRSSKCCHDGCRFQCIPVYNSNDPCSSVVCLSHQVCNVSKEIAYCLDTCRNNGPCDSLQVCRLVDQDCSGALPCPKRARCEKPACVGDTHTYRTNRPSFSISYPGHITSTTCGRFNGSVVIIATNGQCINVTADVRYPNPKAGETIKVYDGQAPSKRLRFQGQSLRNVYFVSSGPTMTIVFTTPDISASIGIYLFFRLQSTCHIAYTVERFEVVTTPNPIITTESITTPATTTESVSTTRIVTTPATLTESVSTTRIVTTPATTESVSTTRIVTASITTTDSFATTQIVTTPIITTDSFASTRIVKSQTVVSTSEPAPTNKCPHDCPTPGIGCTLIKTNDDDDCCGEERCFL